MITNGFQPVCVSVDFVVVVARTFELIWHSLPERKTKKQWDEIDHRTYVYHRERLCYPWRRARSLVDRIHSKRCVYNEQWLCKGIQSIVFFVSTEVLERLCSDQTIVRFLFLLNCPFVLERNEVWTNFQDDRTYRSDEWNTMNDVYRWTYSKFPNRLDQSDWDAIENLFEKKRWWFSLAKICSTSANR